MNLTAVRIVGLYGTVSLEVSFRDSLTLLIGINGSGKTSVLNTIDWMLKPDLKRLAITQFETLHLEFIESGVAYALTASKDSKQLVLRLSGAGEERDPITVELLHGAESESDDEFSAYDGLTLEKHELPLWSLLKSFQKPTVISLDRTISAEADDTQYLEAPRSRLLRRTGTRSPIGHVQDVTSRKYAEFRFNQIRHDEELKASIVMSALQDPEAAFHSGEVQTMSSEEIVALERKVTAYLSSTIKAKGVEQQVGRFFSLSRALSGRSIRDEVRQSSMTAFVAAQYRQVENLARAFNEFEDKNAQSFRHLRLYLNSVNKFFKDSGKTLEFDESTGRLVFRSSKKERSHGAFQEITRLSSGERQILILFTFLAFVANQNSVFIVDEPELSLHPKWQHEFMDSFLALRPAGTQILLATHSPDIVGKHREACVTLKAG